MKRVLTTTILGIALILSSNIPAQAGFIADKKAAIQQARIEKSVYKDIENLFEKQDEYAARYDLEGLKTLYGDKFINCDGYNKEVYFSLVKETWETYPDITYSTEIKNIKLNGDYATVETHETAVATTQDDMDIVESIGELNSTSNCIYHLERGSNNKWVISGEQVLDEVSTLKYGDARFVKMSLESPTMIGAGQEYNANLKVDLPSDVIVIASINQEKIVNPAAKPEEKFRKLSEEQTLSRIFKANTENLNEYNVASVGITRAEAVSETKFRVYMNGLAFIMTRINVVPKNNFAEPGDADE